MTLYKFTDESGRTHNGEFQWSLPVQNTDGSWTPGNWAPPIVGRLHVCKRAYHAAKNEQILSWLRPRMFEIEFRARHYTKRWPNGDKVYGRQARLIREVTAWNNRTARLFAVWCARQALESITTPYWKSVAACNVAERYANGQATDFELAIARADAISVPWRGQQYSQWAAGSTTLCSASAAARDAAYNLTQMAPSMAARNKARDVQYRQLMQMLGEKIDIG